MKKLLSSSITRTGFFLASLFIRTCSAQNTSPLQKVIELITNLQGQVIHDGEMSQQTYKKYSDWCENTSKEKQYEISEGKDTAAELEAAIEKSVSDADEAQARIEELSGSLATDDQDVKAITLIREKEKGEFQQMDAELTSTVDTVSRARGVLQKSLDKAGASSFLQRPTKGMELFAASVNALVSTAMGVSAESKERLAELLQLQNHGGQPDDKSSDAQDGPVSFLQEEAESDDSNDDDQASASSSSQDDDEDSDNEDDSKFKQPEPEVYSNKKSETILEVLEKMQEETETAQDDCRKKETKEKHNYELLKQRLQDRIATQTKELEDAKKELASSKETEAEGKGKLVQVKKDLAVDEKFLKSTQQNCMERASEFEMEMKTRNEELKALAEAKKTIQSIVFANWQYGGSAAESSVTAASFVQVRMKSETSSEAYALRTAGAAVATRLKQLASDEHSMALARLSSHIGGILKRLTKGAAGADPFEKIKVLISNMISKLEKQQAEEAQQKKFCDDEMSQTKQSKVERESTIETLTTRIEQGVAETAKLTQERATLLKEITEIETSQAEMDNLRSDEHKNYKVIANEMNGAIAAVQQALKVLREYYSQAEQKGAAFIQDMTSSMKSASVASSTGVGGGTAIISLLEVCESDFSKALAESEAEEQAAQDAYEKLTQENKVERAVKDKSVQHINSDLAYVEKKNSEFTGDRTGKEQELAALVDYLEKLTKQCVAQPENYHDRVARRQREIEGLQEALEMLESQNATPQAEE
jgi:hypothetical protein